ncbi:hypothetical protein ABZS66_32005 [Dactylosporangium sp. NPDC005572]|uniref:hypothetical protein n=1 Tax=Dactylosporangium sp. NPDC005572 TaxID=3156889 RepID=UPI0033A0DEA1
MAPARRVVTGLAATVVAAGLAALAWYLWSQGLQRADQLGSALGLVVAVAALLVTALGVWQARPPRRDGPVPPGGQASASGRGNIVVNGDGNWIGSTPPAPPSRWPLVVLAVVLLVVAAAGAGYVVYRQRGVPVAVDVLVNPTVDVDDTIGGAVVPVPIGEVGDLSGGAVDLGTALHDYAARTGGADTDRTMLRLTLQGRTDAPVALTVGVRVVERHPVQEGTQLYIGPTGGGDVIPRDVRVDLDAPQLAPRYFVREQEVAAPLVLTLVKGESEVVDLRVSAAKALYHWVAELHLVVDGERSTIRIDDGGHPFRTSGRGGGPRYRFDSTTWTVMATP